MQGILLVDKPMGWTSFDVVNYIRKLVAQAEEKKPKQIKVGHTGTLDPLATGLLVLLVGKDYTRRAMELTKLEKTYQVTVQLGQTSTTGDEEGDKTTISSTRPTQTQVATALQKFAGDSLQTPPIFSAKKVNGQRAYKLAREGKQVVLEPRPIHIAELVLTDYSYPQVSFTATVSSGTYIRSLAEDLGQALQTGAYMAALRRTRVGSFKISQAIAVVGLTAEVVEQNLSASSALA